MVYGEIVEGYERDFERYLNAKLYSTFDFCKDIVMVIGSIGVIVAIILFSEFNIIPIIGVIGLLYYIYIKVREILKTSQRKNKVLNENLWDIVYLPIECKKELTTGKKKFAETKYYFVFKDWGECEIFEDAFEEYEEGDLYPCIIYEFDKDLKVAVLEDWLVQRQN